MAIDSNLWKMVEDQFPMGKNSHHGPRHWRRVLAFGIKLAQVTGADTEVVELFALFHDSRRMNDAIDPGHGVRGAELALDMHGAFFELSEDALDLLVRACRGHTDGAFSDQATIATCWDADRLDLWRVGIYPNRRYLCTQEAKKPEVIDWAVTQSVRINH